MTWTQDELVRALEPVKHHLSGKRVTANTVLAAHMRALRVNATGQPWTVAREALKASGSFEEAALAAKAAVNGGPSTGTSTATSAHARRKNVKAKERDPKPFLGFSWFPKAYGPGDLDGVGSQKLLGTPSLDPTDVLVRETAQNSWDARNKDGSVVSFVMDLRFLPEEAIGTLREEVFVAGEGGLGLQDLLSRRKVSALEITDRGTVGLDGPTRNDLAIAHDKPTNFIDFVLNVGAPRDQRLGGGTYGFGKTAVYSASKVGAVLIWSRTQHEGKLESRLIGSAIGSSFDMEGERYTGRHWWGRRVDERVEPVTGDLADDIGSKVFATGFDEDETGTSILILEPHLLEGDTAKATEKIVDSVRRNLWPKLLKSQAGRQVMDISVRSEGVDVPIPPIESDPVLQGHAACLLAVRAAQGGPKEAIEGFPWAIGVEEIRSEKPKKLLGHLALTRYPTLLGAEEASHGVSLMRNEAELVVKYWKRTVLDKDGVQWAGVFKPVRGVDDSFAAAEPPAHDDWEPAAITDRAKKTDVNVALTRITNYTKKAALFRHDGDDAEDETVSAAVAAEALAGLLVGTPASGPVRKGASARPAGKRVSKPRVSITGTDVQPSDEQGWARRRVALELIGTRDPQKVQLDFRIKTGDSALYDPRVLRVVGWVAQSGEYLAEQPDKISPETPAWFAVDCRDDIAIDVSARVVADG